MSPQNFHVVRCADCRIFQVHIVKKSSNKWNCKVCSTKQSVQQVFGRGSGAECRELVQKLNSARGAIEDEKRAAIVNKLNQEFLEEEYYQETSEGNPDQYSAGCSSTFYQEENPEEEFKIPSLNAAAPTGPTNIVPKHRSKWSEFLDEDCDEGNHLH